MKNISKVISHFIFVFIFFSSLLFTNSNLYSQEEFKLTASDGAIADEFGCSVSISGDYAIGGAYHDNDNGNYSGSAYLFQGSGCDDWLTADLNRDCYVDFKDFGVFANEWLKCSDPFGSNCRP